MSQPATASQPVTTEEALQYEADALESGIEKAKKNIQIFRDAITNEEATIDRYRQMIAIINAHQGK